MGRSSFDFKRFSINQDMCAMKVGTDGVLLGAWADIPAAGAIADVGTGTGLLAIMAAQKSESASVVGIEIDNDASAQAAENMKQSPWGERLSVVCSDIDDYYMEHVSEYDFILSNPPYFVEDVKSYKEKRCLARHTDSLSFERLALDVSVMLKDGGMFAVILPYVAAPSFIANCFSVDLKLKRRTDVVTREGASPKRVMMEFVKNVMCETTEFSELVLNESGRMTDEYRMLTKDFYL